MDIKIPKEVLRYTPEVMKELIDKVFLMTLIQCMKSMK